MWPHLISLEIKRKKIQHIPQLVYIFPLNRYIYSPIWDVRAFVLCLYDDCPKKSPPTDAIGIENSIVSVLLILSPLVFLCVCYVGRATYLFQGFVSSRRIGPSGCRCAAGRTGRGGRDLCAATAAAKIVAIPPVALVEPLEPNALEVRKAAQIFERLLGEGGRRQQELPR